MVFKSASSVEPISDYLERYRKGSKAYPVAIAGNMARKKRVPPGPGSFPVDSGLFVALLVGVILIVGALTFFPALSLGPVVEHFMLS